MPVIVTVLLFLVGYCNTIAGAGRSRVVGTRGTGIRGGVLQTPHLGDVFVTEQDRE